MSDRTYYALDARTLAPENRPNWMLARWGQDIARERPAAMSGTAGAAWRNRALTSSTGRHPLTNRPNRRSHDDALR